MTDIKAYNCTGYGLIVSKVNIHHEDQQYDTMPTVRSRAACICAAQIPSALRDHIDTVPISMDIFADQVRVRFGALMVINR